VISSADKEAQMVGMVLDDIIKPAPSTTDKENPSEVIRMDKLY